MKEVEKRGQRLGDWGVPGYASREAGMTLQTIVLPASPGMPRLIHVAPIPSSPDSLWVALTDQHELCWFELSSGNVRRICRATDFGLPATDGFFLTVSPMGDFAVVAPAKGSVGAVIDLATGASSMMLNRGNYHTEQCRFSAAFFRHEGRTLLIHATDWNRLDISDPGTGELLTPRGPTSYTQEQEPPEHYLDYFHADLTLSPDHEWIADNGWVWAPVGTVRTWNLRDWITRNVWEAESGKSIRQDIFRYYYWNGPLCWVDNCHLAVWGVGEDDYSLLPAVRLIDVSTGEERPPLVGPFAPTEAARNIEEAARQIKLSKQGVLEFDDYLFAWSPVAGFSAWDLADGARVLAEKDFCPLAYNRTTREFISQDASGVCRISKWSTPALGCTPIPPPLPAPSPTLPAASPPRLTPHRSP